MSYGSSRLLRAVFFDQDGVIIDTERDGHRVAFNRTFDHFGLEVHWDEAAYHQLLQVGGGKERMRHHLDTRGFGRPLSEAEADDLIPKMHAHKTQLFVQMIESGELPLRPGVRRLMEELNAAGVPVGICTTSTQRSADAVAAVALKGIDLAFVLAGDVVPAKKPDPAIYRLAIERAGVDPRHAVVIEDSHIGVTAAKAAGLHVVATTNGYTADEDLSAADVVVDQLGAAEALARRTGGRCDAAAFAGLVDLKLLERLIAAATDAGCGS